jgi:hypothetical protein
VRQGWADHRARGQEEGSVGAPNKRRPSRKRDVAAAIVVQHAKGQACDGCAAPAGGWRAVGKDGAH